MPVTLTYKVPTGAALLPTERVGPPAYKPAILSLVSGTNREYTQLEFADGEQNDAMFQLPVPDTYAGGNRAIRIKWISPSTGGNVRWGAEHEPTGDAEVWDEAFTGGPDLITSTANAVGQTKETTINITGTAWTASEDAILHLYRLGADGADTLADVARIISVDILIDVPGTTAASAAGISSARIAGSTYSTVQDMQDQFHSAGWISGGAISDGGDAGASARYVDVTAGTGLIRATDSGNAQLLWTDWSATTATLSCPVDSTRYIGIEYNAGTPQVLLKTSDTWDLNTDFPLGSVVNEGGTLHIEENGQAVGDHAGQMLQRLYETMPLRRDDRAGGLILGETGTRNLTLTSGALWDRLNRFSISALDTSVTGSWDGYYDDNAGGHTKVASLTQWPNTQYDDGSGTLATMTNSRYANLWFFVEADDNVTMMYGTAEYTSLAAAELETVPSDVPSRVSAQSTLLGRIIFQESAAVAAEIQSAFTTTFAATAASTHSNLANLGWSSSGHTGTAFALPAFDTSGAAVDAPILVDGSGNLTPSVTNSNALGTSTLMWSDLFLASGGVLNFDNGNITVTHSAAALAFAGGTAGYTFNDGPLFIEEIAAALADVANFGQIWVRNDTPNVLMFTDDAGTDFELTTGVGILATVENKTASDTLTAADSGKTFTNTGAGAQVILTLPPAVAGTTITAIITATNGIRLLAVGDDTIRMGAASVTPTAGYIEAAGLASSIVLRALNGTEWMPVGGFNGAWTVST